MAKTTERVIELKRMNLQRTEITLVGDSSLIVHAWSAKAKKEMLDTQRKKAKGPKQAKDPERDYQEAFYRTEDGKPGFPCVAFKSAAVSAGGRFADGMKMTELRGMFHVQDELVEIIGEPNMREDMVRVGMGKADIRYRPEFKEWKVVLKIQYNADAVSLEHVWLADNLDKLILNVKHSAQFGHFHSVGKSAAGRHRR